ncbi:MAG: class I SAM-dependent methyltransferase [Armatimonadota bacterium]
MPTPCRLCASGDTRLLLRGGQRPHQRDFLRCGHCDCVFVPDEFLLSPEAERERYALHQNDPQDAGYRAFLRNLLDEIVRRVAPGAEGLDYGCGEPPVLMTMLEDAGLRMTGWDLHFRPDDGALARSYHFIVCSETAEHFRQPLAEFLRFDALLRPGGILGVMTRMLEDWGGFADWHYRFDATHICFYCPRTMRWLARRFGWELELPRPNVAIFRKP